LLAEGLGGLHASWQDMLIALAVLSMVIGNVVAIAQSNLKRMLAYSSLEHVGLICAGFALNTPVTIFGALLHMGYHALAKPVLFFAAGNIHQTFHSLEFRIIGPGVVKVLPATAVCMGLAALAAIGLPPFGLFLSELTIISGGLAAHQTAVSMLILIALLASFCGILQQLVRILLGERKPGSHAGDARSTDGVPAMVMLLAGLLLFSVWLPAPLLELLRHAGAIIGGKP
jgi:hydrogenase-4 component F